MLDIVADTLIDAAAGFPGSTRRLRFAGHGCVVQVDVRGSGPLALDVRVSPDEPATMSVRTLDASGRVESLQRGGGLFTDVPPGLTSVLIRWAHAERSLLKTAWVRL